MDSEKRRAEGTEGSERIRRTVEFHVRSLQKYYKCKCNNVDALMCHQCEEADGVCYCKCHLTMPRVQRY